MFYKCVNTSVRKIPTALYTVWLFIVQNFTLFCGGGGGGDIFVCMFFYSNDSAQFSSVDIKIYAGIIARPSVLHRCSRQLVFSIESASDIFLGQFAINIGLLILMLAFIKELFTVECQFHMVLVYKIFDCNKFSVL